AVIAVYDTYDATGKTLTSDPFLSFRVTSGAYSGFEIESCDISSDGQMYFNVNRWTSSSGNYDAILRFNNFVANGFNPDGNVDVISGGTGTVTVRGWAFDKDCASMSIPVHVYIGGPAGSGEGHAITANTYRSDVNGAFGCGNYHGFDATISTSLRGSQPVYLYAINTRKGTNVMIGSGWVNITNETNAPGIGNVRVTEVSANGYRVTCDVWDDTGVTSVKFPTWTANNGQDDLVWHEGSVSGNTATCYISRNDHKGEYGTYFTHIYAYDGYGNQSCNGDTNVYLEQPLSIYNYGIVDIGTEFYAKIVNVNANKDVAINFADDNVLIYDKMDNLDHIWRFERNADGSYKITNMHNGKCLDVNGAANADGTNVQIWENNGGSAQKWFIYNVGGRYALKAACSDRVLDVNGASTANGANIQTWTFNASGAQIFTIDKVVSCMADMVFDADFYSNKYADLKNAYGTDYTKLYAHFVNYGIKEGRQAHINFDVRYYLNNNKDLINAFGADNYSAAYNHYLSYGCKEGRKTSATMVFDAAYYSNKYSDLKNAFGMDAVSLYKHFISSGIGEGRQACSSYNVVVYLNSNKDLLRTFGDGNFKAAYNHYLSYGFKEGRVTA
ncbi:MAG: RICIN domain-containing protein, partial [Ruminococcus sp.]